jgi:hypothetical protein
MQDFHEFVQSINPVLMGALGFLAGTLVGNWIAIGRDRRREFNDAVKPMRAHIISVRDRPHAMQGLLLSGSEIDFIQHHMRPFRWRRFMRAVKDYERCHDQQAVQDETGAYSYVNPAAVSACASNVLRYLRLR